MKKKTGHIETAADASLTTKRQPRPQPPIDAEAAREWEDAIVKKGGRIQRIQVRCSQAELEYAAACGASWRDLAELIGCTDRTLRNWRRITRNIANDVDAQSLTAEQRKALGVGVKSPEAIRVVMKTIERGRAGDGPKWSTCCARRRSTAIFARQPACWRDSTGKTGRKRKQTRKRKGAVTLRNERATRTAQFPLFPLFGKTRETPNRPN